VNARREPYPNRRIGASGLRIDRENLDPRLEAPNLVWVGDLDNASDPIQVSSLSDRGARTPQ